MTPSKSQQEAIDTINGQLLLVSCPGSGKTSTVVHRVCHMLEEGVPAGAILVLTFSKAAATEMGTRFEKLYQTAGNTPTDGDTGSVTFATIHSFCYNVIAQEYNYSFSDILRETEAWMIIRKGIDELRKAHSLKMEIRDPSEFTSSCLREISVVNNNGVDWDSYTAETCSTDDFHQIYNLYEAQKHAMGKIDFDDMLKICYQLLSSQQYVLDYWRGRFRYIIVDEYQDTNYLQRDIIYLLAGHGDEANLCVVGDDDQSIYGFRGARPEIMLSFKKQYPGAKQIYMDVNYRSEPEIIGAAKCLIQHNRNRFEKDIKPSKQGTGRIVLKENEDREVLHLVKDLQSRYASGVAWEDMAVLYRNNSQANYLGMVLLSSKIPFHSNEKLVSQYRHWIFSDLLAFWRLANGKGSSQDLILVINKPNRFIPYAALKNVAVDRKEVRKRLYSSINEDWKLGKALEQVDDFFTSLELLEGVDPLSFIDVVSRYVGYKSYLNSYAVYRNMSPDELVSILASYSEDCKAHNITTMDEWLAYAEKVNREIDLINKDQNNKGITISTMHRSKGLEWNSVFILGANEGLIPSEKAHDLEEERRLFYVAVTRAREFLEVSWTDKKSPFIEELSKEHKKTVAQKEKFVKNEKVYHPLYGNGTVIQSIKQAILVKFLSSPEVKRFVGEEMNAVRKIS